MGAQLDDKEQLAGLAKLKGFKLDTRGLYNLPQERVEQLNEVAQQQVVQLTSGI